MNGPHTAFNAVGVFDRDPIRRLPVTHVHLEPLPLRGYAGPDDEPVAAPHQTEDRLDAGAVQPTGRTGVPTPAPAADVAGSAINVAGEDVRFDAVVPGRGRRVGR